MKNYNKDILSWIYCIGSMCAILFALPNLDIQISRMFYNGQSNYFIGSNSFALTTMFYLAPLFTYNAAIIYFTAGLYQYFFRQRVSKVLLYLLFTLLIGPGLIVNEVLKNQFGRARPIDIVEFSGTAKFTKICVIADQCQTNCSFSSGHAAGAYWFTNLSFVLPRRY